MGTLPLYLFFQLLRYNNLTKLVYLKSVNFLDGCFPLISHQLEWTSLFLKWFLLTFMLQIPFVKVIINNQRSRKYVAISVGKKELICSVSILNLIVVNNGPIDICSYNSASHHLYSIILGNCLFKSTRFHVVGNVCCAVDIAFDS